MSAPAELPSDQPPLPTPGRMPLTEHLAELRSRLISVSVCLLLTTVACFSFAEYLFGWLQVPLSRIPDHRMIVLDPLEMFITYIKLALLAGIFVSMPWALYQAWRFIAPGLYANEKRWAAPFIILGSTFFLCGGAFAFYIVLPLGFEYLVQMVPEAVETQYSVARYFALVIRLLLAFGLVFELPLIIWVLAAAGIVRAEQLVRARRYWIVISVVLGALLTPPDPLTQMLMALPLLGFFELGVLGARVLGRRNQRKKNALEVGL